jgi:hypothetical protein
MDAVTQWRSPLLDSRSGCNGRKLEGSFWTLERSRWVQQWLDFHDPKTVLLLGWWSKT